LPRYHTNLLVLHFFMRVMDLNVSVIMCFYSAANDSIYQVCVKLNFATIHNT
jgi:hypothetical protein